MSITLRVYVHIVPAWRKGLAARMDNVLCGSGEDDRAGHGDSLREDRVHVCVHD